MGGASAIARPKTIRLVEQVAELGVIGVGEEDADPADRGSIGHQAEYLGITLGKGTRLQVRNAERGTVFPLRQRGENLLLDAKVWVPMVRTLLGAGQLPHELPHPLWTDAHWVYRETGGPPIVKGVTNFAYLSRETGRLDPERLIALYRVSKLVTANVDLAGTLDAVVEAAHQLCGAASTAIMLVDDVGNLEVRAGRGPVADAIGEQVSVDSGIVGRALAEGRTCLVADMHVEPGRARPDLDARTGLRSFVATPLIWQAERLGVLTMGALEPGALDVEDAELLAELAEHAAAAVAHARAFSEEQARRKELEAVNAALNRAQRRLIDTEKQSALGQLAHGIAHELNTPLGVIISNLSVLKTYADSLNQVAAAARDTISRLRAGESAAEVATTLDESLAAAELEYLLEDLPALASESADSAKHMASIVRSVAVFASSSSDRLSAVAVEESVESAVMLAWNELKHRGELVRAYNAVPKILGNATELTQLFVHLLLNAAQSLQDSPGRITVGIEDEAASVAVRITDTGRGIPPEHLSRIFDPFFTTRAIGEGSGMGLSVSRGIVTRHGGTIEIASHVGVGTTVTVRLLRAQPQMRAA